MKETLEKLKTNITKSDFSVLCWISVYAMYIHSYNSFLLTTGRWTLVFSDGFILLVSSVIIFIAFRSIYNQNTCMFDWGLRLDKIGWQIFAVALLFVIGMIIFSYAPFEAVTMEELGTMFSSTVNIISQELVFRAFLISFLIKAFGKGYKEAVLAVIISSLVMAFVQNPFITISDQYDSFFSLFLVSSFYGFAYYVTRSIIVLILFPAFQKIMYLSILFPEAPESYLFYPDILSLMLYLILVGSCLLILRRSKATKGVVVHG